MEGEEGWYSFKYIPKELGVAGRQQANDKLVKTDLNSIYASP
ncbi:hypothetical protein FORC065_4089 [Yersinia enterocolitica]|nr:hypothetical protein FORC065_4089 [Yersinia enterocolitica]